MVDHRKKALWARFNMLHDQNPQEKRTRGKLPQRETRGRWECKMVQPHHRTVGKFLITLNRHLPYNPEIPLLGIYQRKRKHVSTQKFAHEYL